MARGMGGSHRKRKSRGADSEDGCRACCRSDGWMEIGGVAKWANGILESAIWIEVRDGGWRWCDYSGGEGSALVHDRRTL